VGWEKVACWSTNAVISLKRVNIEERYYGGPIGSHQRCFDFWVYAIFLLPVSSRWPPRRPFFLIFARTAQQLVLDGKNGLSSSKPYAYCRIVRSELKPEVVLATFIRHLHPH